MVIHVLGRSVSKLSAVYASGMRHASICAVEERASTTSFTPTTLEDNLAATYALTSRERRCQARR
eukprot:5824891-Prymnesium_polylepis.1